MGIKGLLQALQPSTVIAPIGQFKGQRVAIDASGWLHKVIHKIKQFPSFTSSNLSIIVFICSPCFLLLLHGSSTYCGGVQSLFAVAEDFIDSNFEDTQLYVDYVLYRVRSLRYVVILLVSKIQAEDRSSLLL